MTIQSNFSFLAPHSPLLAQLGATAERLFAFDPASSVAKLRLLGEAMAQDIAARIGIQPQQTGQHDLLRAISHELRLDRQISEMFHLLRRTGNMAAHEAQSNIGYREGLESLRLARELAVWFHRSFGGAPNFKPGPFVLPDDPSQQLATLAQQVDALQAQLQNAQAGRSEQEELARLKQAQAEQEHLLAQQADEERRLYEELADEASAKLAALQKQFDAHVAASAHTPTPSTAEVGALAEQARTAAGKVVLDEASTRRIIDQRLRDAGWSADSETLRHEKGTRPERGRNLAIAEWPVFGGRADYVLFAGLMPVAIVEAKRQSLNVPGVIAQAERYARAFALAEDHAPAWRQEGRADAWPDGQGEHFQLPFVYATNGRSLVRQSPETSGTWFRDVRRPAHQAGAFDGFHSPEGLLDLLKRSKEGAEQKLREEGMAYLHLRDYQQRAVTAVEDSLAEGRRTALVAMATGTGKTRTIIGLMYRLLKAERFRRILFLVDRSALGTQALDAIKEMPLEQNLPLSSIYNIAELGDMAAEAATRVQVATVQAMVRRVFDSESPPTIDAYDCIIVDEAHRGYTLDQEMTEGEQELRSQAQYLSSYRRVIDYFDAFKVAMTATPARHTSEIFGKPIYEYTYREAVADDWLIDYEPPIRYTTLLSQNGIHFERGDTVEALNLQTGEIEAAELEDELDFQVESFNRRVLNESFNRVICEQLAKEIDPMGEEKTLIFCANKLHADTVKRLLSEAFKQEVGEEGYNDAAVQVIVGKTDNVDKAIKRYKNERFPNVAITVDLLTTGIDVPEICNLVFMRRVRSRILYEQMVGRATRRCDAIGKTVFRIYDPVDLYATLEEVNTMKPLVKDPNVTLDQLLAELDKPASYEAAGSDADRSHAHEVLDQLSQKVMRVLRKATHAADKRPRLKERLQQLEQKWGVPADQLHQHLHQLGQAQGPRAAADFLKQHTNLLTELAEVQELMGTAYMPILSQHADVLQAREQSWGPYKKPEDYLDRFGDFIRTQINQSAALAVIVQRPRDLTREDLRQVRLLLDEHGFTEASLRAAWRNKSNLDIAASIVGHIRQAALGEALIPFEQRVARAMQTIYASRAWTPAQRNWLARLARQLTLEVVMDRDFVTRAFADAGGAVQLNKRLDGALDSVLAQLADTLWQDAA